MVAHALDNRLCTGITDAEALTGDTVYIRLTARCTIESHITDYDVLILLKSGAGRWIYHKLSS